MVINNFSSIRLLSQEKPRILSKQEYKLETLLFLPPNYERKAEGGLRGKGYFKHSYKYIGNECLSASNTESKWMLEDSNELMADIFLETIAGDNMGYSNREKQEIDTTYTTDTRKWHICDTDGNPVKPAAMETQEKINEYIHGLSAETHEIPKNTEDKFMIFLPLITVITVVFNGVKTIEETIQSVVNQTYPNIEYIIIDGGSTDGTQDIIKKYGGVIDYWVSEPDNGIYDAMNKGIDLSKGDWILFLNSDDKFSNNNIFKSIFSNFIEKETMLVFGNIYYNSGKFVKSSLNKKILIHNTVHHQASFYNKLLFYNFRYDLNYKIVSDYELNLIIYLKKYRTKHINNIISYCNDGGVSRASFYKAHFEMALIRRKYFNFIINILIDTVLIFKIFLYKFIIIFS